ncbi:MAG: hypothetical protein HY267_05225 [Deltaproteobacteria bacterium]|nr:hypothetical protein [Deltaproteobacteria bacterium]
MRARLVFHKKEVYADGSLTEIRIWQVNKQLAFPTGVKYAFYFVGPPPERKVVVGYDNHHGKGHHRHKHGIETPVLAPSVSALLQQFHREVIEHLRAQGVLVKGPI